MNAIVITINGNTPVSDKCVTEIANKIAKNVGKTIDDIEIAIIDNESLAKLLAKTCVNESYEDKNSHKVSETVMHAINYLQSIAGGSPKNDQTIFMNNLMLATGEGLFVNKKKGILLRNSLDIIIQTHYKGSSDATYLHNLGYTDKIIETCSKCYDLLNVI